MAKAASQASAKTTNKSTKLDKIEALLKRSDGASIAELMKATSWQQHSVRGALAGSLKKRGHNITSDKVDGVRRYRIAS
jgi:N-acetylmuramoyl-L-alanine amidase CwlA